MRGFPGPAFYFEWPCSVKHFDTTFGKFIRDFGLFSRSI